MGQRRQTDAHPAAWRGRRPVSLLLAPATWMLIVIFIVALWVRATSKEAVLGLVCYTLSYALSNAWTLAVDYNMAVPVWQGGLGLILLMYATASRSFTHVLLIAAAVGAATVYSLDITGRRPFELFLMLLIATSVYLIYRGVSFRDPVGKMIWAILLVAEGWAAIEYAGCQFVSQDSVTALMEGWGVTVSKYSCGRAFGEWAAYVAPGITTLALIWVGVNWNRRRLA